MLKKKITECMKAAYLTVKTEEDYVLWVRSWKSIHRELMTEYEKNRACKRSAKIDGNISAMNNYHQEKMAMRYYANNMYAKRIAMKINLHEGKYVKELEAA